MVHTEKDKKDTKKPALKLFGRLNGLSIWTILVIALVLLFVFSFVMGRYPISPADVIKVLISKVIPIEHTWSSTIETVVMQIRLPRILAAIIVGACLALSGVSFQGLFRNPLVSPDILGVSSGAGFGAALAILLSGNQLAIQVSAFCFALLAV